MKSSFSQDRFPARQLIGTLGSRAAVFVLPMVALFASSSAVHAQTSYYSTISLNGVSSDFSGVPVDYTGGGSSAPDFGTLQVANDGNYLYLGLTFDTPLDLQFTGAGSSVYIGLDLDNNVSTGFNVFSAGVIGSELAYQNDFPFQQATGNFNTGATIADGNGLVAPYDDSSTSFYEIGISLDSTANGTPLWADVTPGSTIGIAMYIDDGFQYGSTGAPTDFTGNVQYTLAAPVPEPSTFALLGAGLVSAFAVRRYLPRRSQL